MEAQNIAALPQNLPVLSRLPPPPPPPPPFPPTNSLWSLPKSFERTWGGASLRYHQRLLESNKLPLFLRIWSPLKFKNSPKRRAFGRVQMIAFYSTVQNNEVFPWTLCPTWPDRIHFFKNRFAFEIIFNSTTGPLRGNSTTEQSD